jgi:hypothetical protein
MGIDLQYNLVALAHPPTSISAVPEPRPASNPHNATFSQSTPTPAQPYTFSPRARPTDPYGHGGHIEGANSSMVPVD